VLDVATGPGLAAAAARVRGAMATGVDVSPGMVALARRAHPGIEFQVAEVIALPFPDTIFRRIDLQLRPKPLPRARGCTGRAARQLLV
jgi:ubiquinone/menaquinone biosynthesis C-methylase UbiE